MYKILFIILGTITVICFAVAYYLAKSFPYSDIEPLLLTVGGWSIFFLFLIFLIYLISKHIIEWFLFVFGIIGLGFYIAVLITESHSESPTDATGIIFFVHAIGLISIILLIISIIIFINKRIKRIKSIEK